MKTISVIIPCYQNEGSISLLAEKLMEVKTRLQQRAKMQFVFVNDGSTDGTLQELEKFKSTAPEVVKIVQLTRNFGSYNAFLAGMHHSVGDCHVHLHADLQDPPELIEEMFEHFLKGNKLIIAYRKAREDGSLFSSLYHWKVRRFAIRNIPPGGFDLIMFDEAIRNGILAISEENTNIVYLISWLGYPYVAIPYTRKKRAHGTSQWKFWKKVRLFIDTFFSFTSYPVLLLRIICFLCIITSLLMSGWLIYQWSEGMGDTTSLLILSGIILMLFSGGVIAGILSEYIYRIHETVRNRPAFVVDSVK